MTSEVPEATLGDIGRLSPESYRNLQVAGQLDSQRWREENQNARRDDEGQRGSRRQQMSCCPSLLWKRVEAATPQEDPPREVPRMQDVPLDESYRNRRNEALVKSTLGQIVVWTLRVALVVFMLGFGFWLCVFVNDIARSFLMSTNVLTVANGGEGFEFSRSVFGNTLETITPPENLDFFSVVPVANTTDTQVVLNKFLIFVQNGNVLTLLLASILICYSIVLVVLWKCGPCSKRTWAVATGEDEDDFETVWSGFLCALIAFGIGSIMLVWFYPPDLVGYYEFDEWLYVPGNLEVANGLGYAGMILISSPCWIAIALALLSILGVVLRTAYEIPRDWFNSRQVRHTVSSEIEHEHVGP